MIYPQSKFKKTWDIALIILLLYTATYAPYRTAFMYNDASLMLFAFEMISDLIFLADIFITFISATERIDGSYETNYKRIARSYIISG